MENKKKEIVSIQQDLVKVNSELTAINDQVRSLLSQQEDLQLQKQQLLEDLRQLESSHLDEMSKVNWNADTFSWSKTLESVLKEKFKINCFRPLQKETINVTLSCHDCLLIMPTGGGKSLCFQLPAVLLDKGFTLVRIHHFKLYKKFN